MPPRFSPAPPASSGLHWISTQPPAAPAPHRRGPTRLRRDGVRRKARWNDRYGLVRHRRRRLGPVRERHVPELRDSPYLATHSVVRCWLCPAGPLVLPGLRSGTTRFEPPRIGDTELRHLAPTVREAAASGGGQLRLAGPEARLPPRGSGRRRRVRKTTATRGGNRFRGSQSRLVRAALHPAQYRGHPNDHWPRSPSRRKSVRRRWGRWPGRVGGGRGPPGCRDLAEVAAHVEVVGAGVGDARAPRWCRPGR